MLYLGIDPGKSGGIALVGTMDDEPIAKAWKMPATERDLWHLIYEINHPTESPFVKALIEKSTPMPSIKGRKTRGSAKSNFELGGSYKALRMALIAAAIPFTEIPTGTWQKKLGCLSKGNKNITKGKAQQLFPKLHITHSTADALLIAEYARITDNQKMTWDDV